MSKLNKYVQETILSLARELEKKKIKEMPIHIIGVSVVKNKKDYQRYISHLYKIPTAKELEELGKAMADNKDNWKLDHFQVVVYAVEEKYNCVRICARDFKENYCLAEVEVDRDKDSNIVLGKKANMSMDKSIASANLARLIGHLIKGYKSE